MTTDTNAPTTATFAMTDLGNAQRFAAAHGHAIRYCYAWGQWLVWDGVRWRSDDTGEIERRAKGVVRRIYAEAAECEHPDTRKALADWARRSESAERIRRMIDLTRSEPGIAIRPNDLDADPWLLGCLNGVLDVQTGVLRPALPEDAITKQTNVVFDPDAACPTWLAFLDRIFAGNAALIHFVQQAVGYALTGDTSEQVFFLLHGTGANGKSVFTRTLQELLGDYAKHASFETFLQRERDGIRNDLARLHGARLVVATEVRDGRRLDEAMLKSVAGNDIVTARFLYSEAFEFRPTFKLFLVANHKPAVSDTSHAFWRRCRLIPFTVTIPPAEQDKHLLEKLLGELPGILNWALAGCRAWSRAGLEPPDAVVAATAAYRAENDALGDWLDERCEPDAQAMTPFGTLYHDYHQWAEANGLRPLSARSFANRLDEKGFARVAMPGGAKARQGLRLAPAVPLLPIVPNSRNFSQDPVRFKESSGTSGTSGTTAQCGVGSGAQLPAPPGPAVTVTVTAAEGANPNPRPAVYSWCWLLADDGTTAHPRTVLVKTYRHEGGRPVAEVTERAGGERWTWPAERLRPAPEACAVCGDVDGTVAAGGVRLCRVHAGARLAAPP